MRGRSSDWFIPLGLGLGALVFAFGVVIVAYFGDFRSDTEAQALATATHIETILHHALRTDVHQSLATVLSSRRGEQLLARSIRRVAYVILSNATLTCSEAASIFAEQAPVRFASGHIAIGFEAASRRLFGLPADRLSIGETALLCRTAITGRPPPTPDDALLVRNQLIEKLKRRGVLSIDDLDRERARPFTLAPDPSPIY